MLGLEAACFIYRGTYFYDISKLDYSPINIFTPRVKFKIGFPQYLILQIVKEHFVLNSLINLKY